MDRAPHPSKMQKKKAPRRKLDITHEGRERNPILAEKERADEDREKKRERVVEEEFVEGLLPVLDIGARSQASSRQSKFVVHFLFFLSENFPL